MGNFCVKRGSIDAVSALTSKCDMETRPSSNVVDIITPSHNVSLNKPSKLVNFRQKKACIDIFVDCLGVVSHIAHSDSPSGFETGFPLAVGRNVCDLMTPALAHLHKNIIFPKYASCRLDSDDAMSASLAIHKMRSVVISTSSGSWLALKTHVDVKCTSDGYHIRLTKIDILSESSINALFHNHANLATGLRISDKTHSVLEISILVVDLVNSTEKLKKNGPIVSMQLHSRVQQEARDLMFSSYAPLISLYETVGDSMIFLSWSGALDSYNGGRQPRTMYLTLFAADLYFCVKHVADVRLSASFGSAVCSMIDGQVRLFGLPVTTACRLQGFLSPLQSTDDFGTLNVCGDYYKKLQSDVESLPFASHNDWRDVLGCRPEHTRLKGLGDSILCHKISLSEVSRMTLKCDPGVDTPINPCLNDTIPSFYFRSKTTHSGET